MVNDLCQSKNCRIEDSNMANKTKIIPRFEIQTISRLVKFQIFWSQKRVYRTRTFQLGPLAIKGHFE